MSVIAEESLLPSSIALAESGWKLATAVGLKTKALAICCVPPPVANTVAVPERAVQQQRPAAERVVAVPLKLKLATLAEPSTVIAGTLSLPLKVAVSVLVKLVSRPGAACTAAAVESFQLPSLCQVLSLLLLQTICPE